MDRNAFAPVDTASEADQPTDPDSTNPYTVSETPRTAEPSFLPTPDDLILPTGDDELLVINDFKRVPTLDLRAMTRNPFEFALVFVVFKLLRLRNPPFFAVAFKNPTEITYDQIPEFMRSDFDETTDMLRGLGLVEPRYLTLRAIGSRRSLELIMTTPDGRIQTSYVRVQQRNGKFYEDQRYRGVASRVGSAGGDKLMVTRQKMPQPRVGEIQIAERVKTDSFEVLINRHRQRLSEQAVRPIEVASLVQSVADEERRVIEELIRRRVLRPATAKEVFAIEAKNG